MINHCIHSFTTDQSDLPCSHSVLQRTPVIATEIISISRHSIKSAVAVNSIHSVLRTQCWAVG